MFQKLLSCLVGVFKEVKLKYSVYFLFFSLNTFIQTLYKDLDSKLPENSFWK